MSNRLKYGMIGGGLGSFIGPVHRMAAEMDGLATLVCGAFSSDADRSLESGLQLGLQRDRIYPDYETMIREEQKLPPDERMDFVSIVTPNHLHYAPAQLALENGFHVICDKPLTRTLAEAERLGIMVQDSGLLFGLTHTYTGYPMVKKARTLVQSGALGKIHKVVVTYFQGWLTSYPEGAGNKQALWRTNPETTGKTSTMGDIGTHAENLISYVTGLKILELSALLNTLIKPRKMDDDGAVLIRYDRDVSGTILVSQVATGEENNVTLRVYGDKGGLEWNQEEPNTLTVRWIDKPIEVYRSGSAITGLNAGNRLPAGHPEGFIEAFANVYKNFETAVLDRKQGKHLPAEDYDFPTVYDGIKGMRFLDKVVESSNNKQKWIPY